MPNLYLSEPTRAAKWLRSVLAVWFVDGTVDIRYIIPTTFLQSSSMIDVSSDSDESDGECESSTTVPTPKPPMIKKENQVPVTSFDFFC